MIIPALLELTLDSLELPGRDLVVIFGLGGAFE